MPTITTSELKQALEDLKRHAARLKLCRAPEPVLARNDWDIAVLEELISYRQKEGN
jgi:hypothetical protein